MPCAVISDHVKASFAEDMDGASSALDFKETIVVKTRPFIKIWTSQNTDETTETT